MNHNTPRKPLLRRGTPLRSALALLLAAVLLAACDSINCPLNSTVSAVYTFRDSNGKAFAIGDTLTVTAVGPDTVLVNRLVNQSGMSLPVSYYAPCDTLAIRYADADGLTAFDTLWIEKVSTPHSDDPSCPIHIWHKITNVRYTTHLIDSVVVVNPDINYDGNENIRIHFITE